MKQNRNHHIRNTTGGFHMKQVFTLCLGLLLAMFTFCLEAGGAKLVTKAVEETLEAAAKRSGRVLSKSAEKKLGLELLEIAGKHGDDVMTLVREGGLEVLEQGAKHGDDFWRMCRQCPGASRALALRADDLIPLAKRIGPEVLQIEARTPGMAVRVAEEFGDDAVKVLARQNPQDTTRLLGYAAKADSPETAQLLYKTYSQSSNPAGFLERLSWKQIMAGGLTASMVVAAGGAAAGMYQIGDGLQEGLRNPEAAIRVSEAVTQPVKFGLAGLVTISLAVFGFFAFLLCRKAVKQ